MVIDIITALCIAILTIKVIILEVKASQLSDRLEDTISRNNVQHENIEREVHYINRQYHKLHLNRMYGTLAEKTMEEYIKEDIEALKESPYHIPYVDTDSIKVVKEGLKE